MLMSYEREGWVDDERARLTGRLEVRPRRRAGPHHRLPRHIGCAGGGGGGGARRLHAGRGRPGACRRAAAGRATAGRRLASGVGHGCARGPARCGGSACHPPHHHHHHHHPCARVQGRCTARVRWWPRLWRWSACAARTASSAPATSTRSGVCGGEGVLGACPAGRPSVPRGLPGARGLLPAAAPCLCPPLRRRRPPAARSGPGEVVGLELGTDAASLKNLLTFLTCGFGGGTGACRAAAAWAPPGLCAAWPAPVLRGAS